MSCSTKVAIDFRSCRRTVRLALLSTVLLIISASAPADPQKVREDQIDLYGGEVTGPLAGYVQNIARILARAAGMPNANRVHVTVFDSGTHAAFVDEQAPDEIFITRQTLTIFSDEAELAHVLAHELAHLARGDAHELRKQETRGTIESLWSKPQKLAFSRAREAEADRLSVHYMAAAGYDVSGAARSLTAGGRWWISGDVTVGGVKPVDELTADHPLSEHRVRDVIAEAAKLRSARAVRRNEAEFLSHIEGTIWGNNPDQGWVENGAFIHPSLRIKFQIPQRYEFTNRTSAVIISGPDGKAEFSGGRYGSGLDGYVAALLRRLQGGQSVMRNTEVRRKTIDRLPVIELTGLARTSSGDVDVGIVAYQWDAQHVYHFVTLTRAGNGFGPFSAMVQSLRKLTLPPGTTVGIKVIHVVTVGPNDTVASLARRMPADAYQLERFLALNNLEPGAQLMRGQKVKLLTIIQRPV